MRMLVRLLVFSILANTGLGRACSAASANNVRIDRLVIESNSLPDADRRWIIRLFQQRTYPQIEISIRIQLALQDKGYFKAISEEPKVSFITQEQGRRIARVTVKVEEGAQYRLGQIHFANTTLFPSARLRSLFPLHEGDLYNLAKIQEGLARLRTLYETEGYIDFVAIPKESGVGSHRVIDLVLDTDEGRPYDFGHLGLEGLEPHAGAAKALLNSWKTVQGRRYNPVMLQHWLRANQSNWHVGNQRISDSILTAPVAVVIQPDIAARRYIH